MMTTDASAVFFDSNVLVYANTLRSPAHEAAAKAVRHFLASGTEIWISRQVLREYLAAVTRTQAYSGPIDLPSALARVRDFVSIFRVADETADVTRGLIDLLSGVRCGGRQIHDANIVATMLCHGVRTLVTDNVSDFRRYEPLITVVSLTR